MGSFCSDTARIILACFILLFISSCSRTSPVFDSSQAAQQLLASAGPQIKVPVPVDRIKKAPAKPKVIPPGLIYIYQINGGMGTATIFLNGEAIADLREKRYFVIKVKPGLHRFHVSKPDQGELRLEVGSGMSYFVKNSETFGGFKEKLRLMDIGTADAELRRCKLLEGKDVFKYQIFVKPEMARRS